MVNLKTVSHIAMIFVVLGMACSLPAGEDRVTAPTENDNTSVSREAVDRPRIWPFFAFDNGVGRGQLTPRQQATILADLGYQGIGYTGVKDIPAALEAFESCGLKMFSTYIRVNLKDGEAPYDPELPKAIRQLRGHGTALWIHVHNDQAASAEEDSRAVTLIRQIAAMANDSKLDVVLYAHTGFYVATTADAVRLAKKIDRKNVGASFNLCHFLKQNDESTMEVQLQAAVPFLRLVSINGADSGDTRSMGWDRLIQTLDQGTFKVERVLRLLRQGGYDGPIGLQCYAIKGDLQGNLARSLRAWNKLNRE